MCTDFFCSKLSFKKRFVVDHSLYYSRWARKKITSWRSNNIVIFVKSLNGICFFMYSSLSFTHSLTLIPLNCLNFDLVCLINVKIMIFCCKRGRPFSFFFLFHCVIFLCAMSISETSKCVWCESRFSFSLHLKRNEIV